MLSLCIAYSRHREEVPSWVFTIHLAGHRIIELALFLQAVLAVRRELRAGGVRLPRRHHLHALREQAWIVAVVLSSLLFATSAVLCSGICLPSCVNSTYTEKPWSRSIQRCWSVPHLN